MLVKELVLNPIFLRLLDFLLDDCLFLLDLISHLFSHSRFILYGSASFKALLEINSLVTEDGGQLRQIHILRLLLLLVKELLHELFIGLEVHIPFVRIV